MYKLRYIVGFWLVEMAISTNQKPTIYRNLYENTDTEHNLCTIFLLLKAEIAEAVFSSNKLLDVEKKMSLWYIRYPLMFLCILCFFHLQEHQYHKV